MKTFLSITVALCLSACSATYPIKGKVDATNERFLGTTTVSLAEENGNFNIVTDKNTTCTGSYPRAIIMAGSTISARGSFSCNDGRTGTFAFTGQARFGNGFGQFNNGQKFTFAYGDRMQAASEDAAIASALESMAQSARQPVAFPIPNVEATRIYTPPRSINCTSSPTFSGTSIQTSCY